MEARKRVPARRFSSRQVGGRITTRGEPVMSTRLEAALKAAEGSPSDALTHGFHSYPARMHPAIARGLLAGLPPKTTVLDPFCGSGTVLIEARLLGHRGIGVDLHPLAVRLAELKCSVKAEEALIRFHDRIREVAGASEERVRSRVDSRVSMAPWAMHSYDLHVLKELAGLLHEIQVVRSSADRGALEMLFSAIAVKFSRRTGDTSGEDAVTPKRIRKGLVTEFFERKGEELVERWHMLAGAVPKDSLPPRVLEGDARDLRNLLGPRATVDVVVTSPPYGGTYDYIQHHALRCAWLEMDLSVMRRLEIGSRRRMVVPGAGVRFDREMIATLSSLARVLDSRGTIFMLLGDALAAGRRIPGDVLLDRIAPEAGLTVVASATQPRVNWRGDGPRAEHLVALKHGAELGKKRSVSTRNNI